MYKKSRQFVRGRKRNAEREVKRGDLLVREGSHTDRVLFFEQGIAREYIIADGVEVTNFFHLESTFYIPLASIFLGKEVGSNVELEEDGVVRVAPYQTLERLMAGYLSVQRFTFQMYSMAILRMYEISHSLQSRSASDRYEHLLREQPDIVQRVPLGHIASYLGITQQRLSVIRRQVKLLSPFLTADFLHPSYTKAPHCNQQSVGHDISLQPADFKPRAPARPFSQ